MFSIMFSIMFSSCVLCFSRGQVVLIHSRIALADPELLPAVRQQAKEVLLQKGVELLLGTIASIIPADMCSALTRFCLGSELTCCVFQVRRCRTCRTCS